MNWEVRHMGRRDRWDCKPGLAPLLEAFGPDAWCPHRGTERDALKRRIADLSCGW
jgi:hypothetical protein